MKRLIGLILCGCLLSLSLFAGGKTDNKAAAGKPVELVWYVGGGGPQPDMPLVLEAVNKYLKEKINCTLSIIETDFGNYDQKMQMVIAGQEVFDLCFTSDWSNNYYNNVNKNAFLELDDLLTQYAPQLKASISGNGWEAVKVNGKIMAIPNQQIWARTNALMIETSYINKYNFDVKTIKKLADAEPIMALIKKDKPSMYPMSEFSIAQRVYCTLSQGIDEIAGYDIPAVIMLNDPGLKVVNQFELPQTMEYYRLKRQWYQKGYIRPDASTITDIAAENMAGRHPVDFAGTMKPGGEIEGAIGHGGRPIVFAPFSDAWQTTSGIVATMTAISRTSKNPAKAMEFLNLINTDPYLFNLITYGIEGKHYRKINSNYIAPIDDSGYANGWLGWMYGNQFLAHLLEGQDLNVWDETKKLNQSAKASPALGFSFDPTPVQTEIASISAVASEYTSVLDTGAVDPERALPEFLAKLKAAGSDRVVAEVQRQINAWKATKK
jgi:putative aldouronate transport system substrate-binding protein